MKCSKYFIYNGQQFGAGTKVQFTYEFYERSIGKHVYLGNPKYGKPYPSIFNCILYENGKAIWYFNNCVEDNFVPGRDIESIIHPMRYIEKTDKDRIREKKEQGKTWEYIWPGTIIYILSMIFMPIFKEFIWGWIAATILYRNYCYEKLST